MAEKQLNLQEAQEGLKTAFETAENVEEAEGAQDIQGKIDTLSEKVALNIELKKLSQDIRYIFENKNAGDKTIMLSALVNACTDFEVPFQEVAKTLGITDAKEIKYYLSKEITEEERDAMDTISNAEFLAKYSRKDRLKMLTRPTAHAGELKSGSEVNITFTFAGEYNKDLWRETTAGQILPMNVSEINYNGIIYNRNGSFGEFFSSSGIRFTIHEGTNFSVQTRERDVEKMHNTINKDVTEYITQNPLQEGSPETVERNPRYALAYYAKLWGMDPSFIEISLLEYLKSNTAKGGQESLIEISKDLKERGFSQAESNENTAEMRIEIERSLTKMERHKVNYRNMITEDNGRIIPEFAADIFYTFHGDNWERAFEDYGYNIENDLNGYNPSQAMNDKTGHIPDNLPSNTEGLPTGSLGKLAGLIAGKEAGAGGFDAYNRGNAGDSAGKRHRPPFSDMTVGEIMKKQRLPAGNPNRLFAVGMYQAVPDTLAEAVRGMGIGRNEKFTPAVQNKVFYYLVFLKRPALGNYLQGKHNNQSAALNALALEWAGMVDARGNYRHGGKANNASGSNADLLQKEISILQEVRQDYIGTPGMTTEQRETESGPDRFLEDGGEKSVSDLQSKGVELDPNKMVLTADICSCYLHSGKRSNVFKSLALIKQNRDIPITLFVSTSAFDDPTLKNNLVDIKKNYPHVTFAPHGHTHNLLSPNNVRSSLYGVRSAGDMTAVKNDIRKSVQLMEEFTGKPQRYFRAPTLGLSNEVKKFIEGPPPDGLGLILVSRSERSDDSGGTNHSGGTVGKGRIYLGHVINPSGLQSVYNQVKPRNGGRTMSQNLPS